MLAEDSQLIIAGVLQAYYCIAVKIIFLKNIHVMLNPDVSNFFIRVIKKFE